MKRSILFTYVIAIILLVLGSLIYIFFRDSVIFTSWMSEVVSVKIPDCGYMINHETFVGGIFLYSLADAMWYGSLLLFELPLRSDNWCSRMMTFAVMVLPFVLELLQFFGIIVGTFDMNDILTYVLTLITFLLCSKKIYCNC